MLSPAALISQLFEKIIERKVEEEREKSGPVLTGYARDLSPPTNFWISVARAGQTERYLECPSPIYGERMAMRYADFIAGAPMHEWIDEFHRQYFQVAHANPHTTMTPTGKFSNENLKMASGFICQFYNANDHIAVPVGSGATGAIDIALKLLTHQLGTLENGFYINTTWEHHSNSLPFMMLAGKTGYQELDLDTMSMQEIEAALQTLMKKYNDKTPVFSISLGSNVTGRRITQKRLNEICELVHQHKGIVMVDLAGAGPYIECSLKNCDAAFVSPHKYIGGKGTPGVGIYAKSFIPPSKPIQPAGGTVKWVTPWEIVFHDQHLADLLMPGTPNDTGFEKFALILMMYEKIGMKNIEHLEHRWRKELVDFFNSHSKIHALEGMLSEDALAIFALNVAMGRQMATNVTGLDGLADTVLGHARTLRPSASTTRLLMEPRIKLEEQKTRRTIHHTNTTVMHATYLGGNMRDGCFCAGPFNVRSMGLTYETSCRLMTTVAIKDLELFRPGSVRDTAHPFYPATDIDVMKNHWNLIAHFGPFLLEDFSASLDGNYTVRQPKNRKTLRDLVEEDLLNPAKPDAIVRGMGKEKLLRARQIKQQYQFERYITAKILAHWFLNQVADRQPLNYDAIVNMQRIIIDVMSTNSKDTATFDELTRQLDATLKEQAIKEVVTPHARDMLETARHIRRLVHNLGRAGQTIESAGGKKTVVPFDEPEFRAQLKQVFERITLADEVNINQFVNHVVMVDTPEDDLRFVLPSVALGIDCIDFFYLHRDNVNPLLEQFKLIKTAGKQKVAEKADADMERDALRTWDEVVATLQQKKLRKGK